MDTLVDKLKLVGTPLTIEAAEEIEYLTEAVIEEVKNRDDAEEAFSKAYSLVMGQPMEWSCSYNLAEALGDMEERLAECRAALGIHK